MATYSLYTCTRSSCFYLSISRFFRFSTYKWKPSKCTSIHNQPTIEIFTIQPRVVLQVLLFFTICNECSFHVSYNTFRTPQLEVVIITHTTSNCIILFSYFVAYNLAISWNLKIQPTLVFGIKLFKQLRHKKFSVFFVSEFFQMHKHSIYYY